MKIIAMPLWHKVRDEDARKRVVLLFVHTFRETAKALQHI
jgi:hypothetical protein